MKPIEVANIAAGVGNMSGGAAACGLFDVVLRVVRDISADIQRQATKQGAPLVIHGPNEATIPSEVREKIVGLIREADEALADAALPQRLTAKLSRIRDVAVTEHFDAHEVKIKLEDLVQDLVDYLSEPMFLHVQSSKRHLYQQKEPPFGPDVESRFPEASKDVAAASRCLALDEWTACVLHLMRALETPLHALAHKVGVTFPSPIELETWKVIIEKIEAEIHARVKKLEQEKKSSARNDALKAYAESALQFRHFKNAWRNNAAHGREWYDEREAERVYMAVKDFMQTIAGVV